MLTSVWHTSFHVSDLATSVRFYQLLRLELVVEQEQRNEYTASLVGYPDAHLKVAQLLIPQAREMQPSSGHHLELVEYVVPRREPPKLERSMPGTGHLAFLTDDIMEDYQRLVSEGVHFVSAPNDITAGVNRGGKTCYFIDPDGITLELVQSSRDVEARDPWRRPQVPGATYDRH